MAAWVVRAPRGQIRSVKACRRVGDSDAASRFSPTVMSSNSSRDWKDRARPSRARSAAVQAVDDLPVQANVAGGHPLRPGDGVDEGGLAGPVGPDQPHDLARVDGQADPVDGPDTPEGHDQAVDLDGGGMAPLVGLPRRLGATNGPGRRDPREPGSAPIPAAAAPTPTERRSGPFAAT